MRHSWRFTYLALNLPLSECRSMVRRRCCNGDWMPTRQSSLPLIVVVWCHDCYKHVIVCGSVGVLGKVQQSIERGVLGKITNKLWCVRSLGKTSQQKVKWKYIGKSKIWFTLFKSTHLHCHTQSHHIEIIIFNLLNQII